ncbi:MAG: amidohydrolase [Rhizobiales bacterium]|nr:amidohydrolase family protein [Hyphomicrobiales bacterium]NRB15833.1 amidohydrolase [Hyphomicrobiales bacterium]
MTTTAFCDCHVNIWNDEHILPLYKTQLARVRAGDVVEKADADTLYQAMTDVQKAIIFSLRYGDSVGIEGNDEITAMAVAKYPDKFVGFAYVDPRRADYMDLLHHAIEDLGLKGVKFGPIYNGVALSDPRLEPVYEYLQRKNIPLTMHMGTTFARQAPVDMGRAIHVEPVALKYPELTMVLAHMGHPWYEEAIVVARKQPNVWLDQSALFYRPWQYYNMLILAQEYKITDKIFFGTDFPFAKVDESVAGLRNINNMLEGTKLPRVSSETIEGILRSNPFEIWWKGDNPL